MRCPYCNGDNVKVLDSRDSKDKTTIKRRRECSNCEKRFSTIEKVLKLDLEVQKSNGEVEEFNLPKIKKSIIKACTKRPVTLEQIENLENDILTEIKQEENFPIETSKVGRIVLKHLKKLDEIAFLRYIIVHNNYDSINEFVTELDDLNSLSSINYKKK